MSEQTRIPFDEIRMVLRQILLRLNFPEDRASLCADVFATNSRDGVYSHGVTRFPVFVDYVKKGMINITAEPELLSKRGGTEIWDGHLAPGIYTATKAMDAAISLALENGIGCVAVKNTNHWMRGGTYGLQAAEAGCIGICFTNTIANMPPWGGKQPRLGNNPIVVAVPRKDGHLLLDMALSQYSYGKLQETQLKHQQLPVPGGFNEAGQLTKDPGEIIASWRALPVGFWKGAAFSFILDAVLTALTGGKSVFSITETGKEYGLSQIFLCIHQEQYNESLINELISFTKTSEPVTDHDRISYPGERMKATRLENEAKGIPVNAEIWRKILKLLIN